MEKINGKNQVLEIFYIFVRVTMIICQIRTYHTFVNHTPNFFYRFLMRTTV